jgi:hypothetical protein
LKAIGNIAATAALSLAGVMGAPNAARAYQIDCAILLCLAGGWPASVECTRAKAVFIRRITPWPIEPPLQIWRCPMRSARGQGAGSTATERLRSIAFAEAPQQLLSNAVDHPSGLVVPAVMNRHVDNEVVPQALHDLALLVSAKDGTADVDISAAEFNFVRSIKVWNVVGYSHEPRGRDHECREHSNITLGTYGTQGDFEWRDVSPDPVPRWVIASRTCVRGNSTRAVGVEWADSAGNHGSELVRY